ncbi:hypothetical protein FB567DRAFT_167311 [Paraphoma chrysanthemicola]|uniref:C2H2-type domain-containing protein n=1 Tax=Paraphoma chrysanthemicola TaxID=798071 RepID=A0A8K0RGS0_9PLEO|nr:hypothetical protein FB567DRAFT_167311 [Paraphoma chrysanthemicola]
MGWPAAPAQVQSLGLFEMDAVENEFNPWLHGPIPTVLGVPHRWEKTPGTDRMFFEAEHDLFPRRKKRRASEQAARDAQRQPCEFIGARAELPAFDAPTELYAPQVESHSFGDLPLWDAVQVLEDSGECSTMSSAFPSYDSIFSEGYEVMQGGSQAADAIYTPITPSSATSFFPKPNVLSGWDAPADKPTETWSADWNMTDFSFATVIANSHYERVRFFTKFCYPGSTTTQVASVPRIELNFDGDSSQTSSPTDSPTSAQSDDSRLALPTLLSSGSSAISITAQDCSSPVSIARTASSDTTASIESRQHACPECDLRFRTPGQKRNHYNRRHNLRYKCTLCTAAFGLRKDLERHKTTVHKDLFQSQTRLFCSNVGCATPDKEFNRRDNFQRHVERCRLAIVTRGTAQ